MTIRERRAMDGPTWMPMEAGMTFPVRERCGNRTWRWIRALTRMAMGVGCGIRAEGTCGPRVIRGAGLHTAAATGRIGMTLVGDGNRESVAAALAAGALAAEAEYM